MGHFQARDLPPHIPLPHGTMVGMSKKTDPHPRCFFTHIVKGPFGLEEESKIGVRIAGGAMKEEVAVPERLGVFQVLQEPLVFGRQALRGPDQRLIGQNIKSLGEFWFDGSPVMIAQNADHLPLLHQIHAFSWAGVVANQIAEIDDQRDIFFIYFDEYGPEGLEV